MNSAPKSPRSVPLRADTAACVYMVQDHTFIVWQEFCFHNFCVVVEVLGLLKFSHEEDFVAFLLGRKRLLDYKVEYKNNLTGSQKWLPK